MLWHQVQPQYSSAIMCSFAKHCQSTDTFDDNTITLILELDT